MILEQLFRTLYSEDKLGNPFETPEINTSYAYFCDTYIFKDSKDYDESEKMWDDFVDVIWKEQHNAFKVGFKTAVSLIMSN